MIRGTLADKIFGLDLNPIENAFYKIGKYFSRKTAHMSSHNILYLYDKNIAYIDKTIFSHDRNRDMFIENMQKELQEEMDAFDISQYIYITSLQGKTITDIENPLFPHNLYHDLIKGKSKYVILFFDPDMIGTQKMDIIFNRIKSYSMRLCIGEKYDYGLLKYKYLANLFIDIKRMIKM